MKLPSQVPRPSSPPSCCTPRSASLFTPEARLCPWVPAQAPPAALHPPLMSLPWPLPALLSGCLPASPSLQPALGELTALGQGRFCAPVCSRAQEGEFPHLAHWTDVDLRLWNESVQFSSVAQSCPTLCDPMDCRTTGLPVNHQLPEFTQTYVHRTTTQLHSSHTLEK